MCVPTGKEKELAFYGRKDEFHGQRRIVFEEPSVKRIKNNEMEDRA